MHSVILCGGSGTRLWPLSRKDFPKQFLNLYSDNSLLQETYLRMRQLMAPEHIFFVTNEGSFYNVYNQIKDIEPSYNKDQILVEPESLNTAPAITLAIKLMVEKHGVSAESPTIFLPSDHYIGNEEAFIELVGMALANIKNHVGTIGITPTKPETGFGYIKKNSSLGAFYGVEEFKEKPDEDTAIEYLESGNYVWNSGMYLFTPNTLARELMKHEPKMFELLKLKTNDFIANFSKMPNRSIDVAVSEKSDNVVVFEGNFGWNDIGSFDSLAELSNDNGFKNNHKHINVDSKNIYVHTTKNKLIVTLGVNDINIIENNDSILIHKKGRSNEVKDVVNILKQDKYKEINNNVVSYRPWGYYEVLIDSPNYKVKKIVVYPGSQLNTQTHFHRSEHWIIAKGVAKIENGEHERFLHENESTFITPMTPHKLENPGKINLEMIEVQTGNYLDEDDTLSLEQKSLNF